MWLIGLGVLLLGVGGWLYFFLLPQVDRPPQFHQSWLTQCPHCQTWHLLPPFSHDPSTKTNWYRCPSCRRKWSEPS